jgi:hypothetical protein
VEVKHLMLSSLLSSNVLVLLRLLEACYAHLNLLAQLPSARTLPIRHLVRNLNPPPGHGSWT